MYQRRQNVNSILWYFVLSELQKKKAIYLLHLSDLL